MAHKNKPGVQEITLIKRIGPLNSAPNNIMNADRHNLRKIILNTVNQLNAPLMFFNELQLTRRGFNKIVICGMGGSALIGDFLRYFQNAALHSLSPKIPVFTHRSYNLPKDADQQSLIICVSYSGNTEETISAFNQAIAKDLAIAGITAGGQLADLFQKNKLPWIKIAQNDMPPRMSLGYQLSAMAKILMAYGLLDLSAQNTISSLSEKIIPSSIEDRAKILSAKLNHKIPIIYASQNNEILAKIWKINFNENAKIPAFFNTIPELNHNEMVGWTKNLGPFHLIFLKDANDLPFIKKRMKLTAAILHEQNIPVDSVEISGDNSLEKIFWASSFADWVSYHLAIFYGLDPGPVEMVEKFKELMKS